METMIKKNGEAAHRSTTTTQAATLCFLERAQVEPRSRAATGRLGRSRS